MQHVANGKTRARELTRAMRPKNYYCTVNGTVTECWRLPDVAVTVIVYDCGVVGVLGVVVGGLTASLDVRPPLQATQAASAAIIANPRSIFRNRELPTPIRVTPKRGIHSASAKRCWAVADA